MMEDINDFIFSSTTPFEEKALKNFHFQYNYNPIYKRFADSLKCSPSSVKNCDQIPFLPISFFKTHKVVTSEFHPELVFTSSGTTNSSPSQHFVKEPELYESSFIKAFERLYGNIADYCILGLLPSYLERTGSSLVYMTERMMQLSGHPLNGFHLYDYETVSEKLLQLEKQHQKTLLIGVTFALLDFANKHPMPLKHTIVMETGGMKGKAKEVTREEVHVLLRKAFGLKNIHSEYGMTELLSQAYALSSGIFQPAPWMKILIRQEDDPLAIVGSTVNQPAMGAINIIDLANIYSCSFLATDDLGKLYPDGSFEVLGRLDNSDIRGCALMAL
jgi:phenylacetate-coenzyme A ligase PaaK-like adenylate-forming protein